LLLQHRVVFGEQEIDSWIYLLSSGLYRRFWIFTRSTQMGSRTITAGREFHRRCSKRM